MALVEHLTSADVLLAPQVNSKWELIDLMVERLVSSGSLDASMEGAAKSALVEREKSVSTGMEHGIAVPHAALDDLHCLKVAMGLIPDGLEFQTVDGKPAEIVILVLVPKQEKVLHLSTLTEVARRLGSAEFRTRLLAVENGEEAVACWS